MPSLSYPKYDRPRGIDDLKSVWFYRQKLQNDEYIEPIWIVNVNNTYILLDGAHRLVASYQENKNFIYSYIIEFQI